MCRIVFGPCDQRLNILTKCFCLRDSSKDTLLGADEEGDGHVLHQRLPVGSLSTQMINLVSVSHFIEINERRPSINFIAEGSIRRSREQIGERSPDEYELVFVEVVFRNVHSEAQAFVCNKFFEFAEGLLTKVAELEKISNVVTYEVT